MPYRANFSRSEAVSCGLVDRAAESASPLRSALVSVRGRSAGVAGFGRPAARPAIGTTAGNGGCLPGRGWQHAFRLGDDIAVSLQLGERVAHACRDRLLNGGREVAKRRIRVNRRKVADERIGEALRGFLQSDDRIDDRRIDHVLEDIGCGSCHANPQRTQLRMGQPSAAHRRILCERHGARLLSAKCGVSFGQLVRRLLSADCPQRRRI